MRKMVLLVLLSVMSVGVAADSAHAIFGGRAWRATARQEGYGLFGLRKSKTGRFFRKSAAVEVQDGPFANQSVLHVREIVDGQIEDWEFLTPGDAEDPFKEFKTGTEYCCPFCQSIFRVAK